MNEGQEPHENLRRTMKSFDKIQYTYMIKTWKDIGMQEIVLNLMKNIYKKPTANIMLNGKGQNAFLLRLKTIRRFLPLLFNISVQVLAWPIREEKELKDIHTRKENVK